MKLKLVYVGYDSSMRGGIQNASELMRRNIPEVCFHASIKDFNNKCIYTMFSVIAYFRFMWTIFKFKPHIAHILIASPFDLFRNIPYIFLARYSKTNSLLHFRYNIAPEINKLPFILKRLVKRTIAKADLLVFLSERLRKDFKSKTGSCKSIVMPNPVPNEYLDQIILPFEQRKQRVIYLGRFSEDKGIYDLLEAAKIHFRHDKNTTYHFYGDGVYPKEYPPNCHFHSWISGRDKLEAIRKAKILVLPSHNEAFPNVVLEAISCGTPVVATSVGGTPDIIQNNVNGVLIKRKDVVGLLRSIEKLMYNEELWDKCSRNGRASAYLYDEKKIFGMWQKIYSGLI